MRLELDLDHALWRRLEQEADRQDLSPDACVREYLVEHLPPRLDTSLADYERDGVRYQLARLSDTQIRTVHQQSIAIDFDDGFHLRLLYPLFRDEPGPQLGELYAALRSLFGESGRLYDDYKGSFSFPFLLYVKRTTGRHRYLLEVADWKGGLEFRLRRVIERPDELGENYQRGRYHEPFTEEFSREEIHAYLARFYGFLQGYAETLPKAGCQPFVRGVRSNYLVYGYWNGEFFEDEFDSEEEYLQALGLMRERAAAQPADSGACG